MVRMLFGCLSSLIDIVFLYIRADNVPKMLYKEHPKQYTPHSSLFLSSIEGTTECYW